MLDLLKLAFSCIVAILMGEIIQLLIDEILLNNEDSSVRPVFLFAIGSYNLICQMDLNFGFIQPI